MDLLKQIHIASGFACIALAIIILLMKKGSRNHIWLGRIYVVLYTVLCGTALKIALDDWDRLWWFGPVAIGSYAFCLLGVVAVKLPGPPKMAWHITGMGSSIISLATAALVINWYSLFPNIGNIWAWIVPGMIGGPIIGRTVRRFQLR